MGLFSIAARIAIRSKSFDLAKFRELRTPEEALKYASENLESLGSGSSRQAFVFSSGKVLKVAIPFRGGTQAGVDQNRAEVEAFTNPKLRPITTRIFDYDPEFSWIISEIVRPLSAPEFESLAGASLEEFVLHAQSIQAGHRSVEKALKSMGPKADRGLLEGIVSLLKNGQAYTDLETEDHWGKAADGSIVVLDYGLTNEGYHKNYHDSYDDEGDSGESWDS